MRSALRLTMATVAAALVVGCEGTVTDRDPADGYPNHNAPYGRIEGTVVYDGPPPTLDAEGQPLGRVVLLLFRADNPPPPQGFATSAESVQTIPATRLFAGVTRGARGVRASVDFTFPNIRAAGGYQLRAFYSNRPESQGFHPVYGVRSQPQRGDVGGGALVDPGAALPVFDTLVVGRAARAGGYEMPAEGAVTAGVTVFLGAPIGDDRPVFRVEREGLQGFTAAALEAPPAPGPGRVAWANRTGFLSAPGTALVLPGNVTTADPLALLGALPALTLAGGMAGDELRAAANAGVVFQNPVPFAVGTPYQAEHPTLFAPNVPGMEPPVLRFPWVFPLVLLARLHDPTPEESAVLAETAPDPAQLSRVVSAMNQPERARPVVVFGSVVPDNLPLTRFGEIVRPPPAPPTLSERVRVVFPPLAFEIGGPVPARDWRAVVPRLPGALARALEGRLPPGSRCSATGLPAGRYALLVVSSRGASWSLPNELAPSVLLPGARTAVASQGVVVRIEASQPVADTECPPGLAPM
jgi:hypothetical protein